MPGGAELQGPVGYDDRWLLLAVLALTLVAGYYLAVLWWCRDRAPRRIAVARSTRESCLLRIDEIQAEVVAGRLAPRSGHQALSAEVRGFVADATGVPASTMTLADLRRDGPEELVGLVALIYPPAFVGDERVARGRFDDVLVEARRLVGAWP